MPTVVIEINNKDTIQDAVETSSKVAKAINKTISFTFNRLLVVVGPNHNPDVVIDDYIRRASIAEEEG